MTVVHVPGEECGNIMLYALSTCGWCQKTKELLDGLGVAYDYEYVDQLIGDAREKAIQKVESFNPSGVFPTIILDKEKCIVGYREDKIREALGK